MKNIFSTLIVLIILSVFSPCRINGASANQLVTVLNVFDNDTTFRYQFFYNNQAKKVLETKYFKKDNSWILDLQKEWIYEGNNCITQRENVWKDGSWKISFTIDYEYVNNQLMSETHKSYLHTNPLLIKKIEFQYALSGPTSKNEFQRKGETWVLSLQTNYIYFPNKKTETVISDVYQSGILENQYRSVFSYNVDGSVSTQLLQQKELNKDWMNTEFINWYYKSGTSLILSQRCKKWISETSSWENIQKIENQYNPNNDLISESYHRWKSMFWENDTRYDYVYDKNALEIKKILLLPVYNKWREIISINYSDFKNNKSHLIESKYEFWGGNTGELTTSFIPFIFNNDITIQKGKRINIVYSNISDSTLYTPDIQNSIRMIPVYPNPSNGIYYINTQEYGVKSWTVSDLQGKALKMQLQTLHSGVIDITDLPKGIYILRVKTQESQFIQKLIKE